MIKGQYLTKYLSIIFLLLSIAVNINAKPKVDNFKDPAAIQINNLMTKKLSYEITHPSYANWMENGSSKTSSNAKGCFIIYDESMPSVATENSKVALELLKKYAEGIRVIANHKALNLSSINITPVFLYEDDGKKENDTIVDFKLMTNNGGSFEELQYKVYGYNPEIRPTIKAYYNRGCSDLIRPILN